MRTIVIAIITPNDDISLACTTSMLRLQQVTGRRTDVRLDVCIVPTFLEALNTFGDLADGDYVVAIDATVGIPPDFVLGVLDSKHPVVAGVYPLGTINWDRVGKVLRDPHDQEPINHAGNVYNVTPSGAGALQRYVAVSKVLELKVVAIAASKLREMAGPDISYEHSDKTKYLFAHDSVFENAYQNPYQTFARKVGDIVVDLESPCILSAPAQFAGCVGMRQTLR